MLPNDSLVTITNKIFKILYYFPCYYLACILVMWWRVFAAYSAVYIGYIVAFILVGIWGKLWHVFSYGSAVVSESDS
jgi:hypothetical protein